MLSIAIITRDRAKSLFRCLTSLQRQKKALLTEVIVIDNASSDNTRKTVLSFQNILPIRYVKEEKIGIAYARNRALREAKGELLAFIDDDCEATPTWVEEMVKAHKKYPTAIAIQGKCMSVSANTMLANIVSLDNASWIYTNSYSKNKLLVLDTKNVLLQVRMLKNKEIFFDTRFQRGSDFDIAKQIVQKKQSIIYAKEVVVKHHERSLGAFYKQYYVSGKAMALLHHKWYIPSVNDTKVHKKSAYQRTVVRKKYDFISGLMFLFLKRASNVVFKFGFESQRKKISLLQIPRQYEAFADLSVCIVTKDRSTSLYQCLFSLVTQSYKVKEVIIIDSSQKKSTTGAIIKTFEQLLPIQYFYESAQGISHARNTALQEARGELVAFIDDDCEATPTWVEEMVKAHKKYPTAIAIQGKCIIWPSQGILSSVMQNDYDQWIKKNLRADASLLLVDFENSSFKTGKLKTIGIHCDMLFKRIYYCEDIDFGFQLLLKNEKIQYYAEAVVFTKRRKTLFALMKQRWLKGKSRALLDYKWMYTTDTKNMYINNKKNPLGIGNNIKRKTKKVNKKISWIEKVHIRKAVYKILYRYYFLLYHGIYKYSYAVEQRLLQNDYQKLFTSHLKKEKKESHLTVSVMIITKDRDTLERSILSLVKQTILPDEVIIIDSSEHVSEEKVKKYQRKLHIKYIHVKKLGFGIARNTAMRLASCDIVATLDDDAQASVDFIKNIKRAHAYFSEYVAIQGRVISLPTNSIISMVEQLHIERWFLRRMATNNDIYALSTKNVSFKREKFIQHRLHFNENLLYATYGSEDVDMANQMIQKDVKILFESSIIVYHWERNTVKGYLQQQRRKGISNAAIAKDWPEMMKRQKMFFPFQHFIDPIITITSNPLTKHKYYLYPYLLLLFYLADLSYIQGKKKTLPW